MTKEQETAVFAILSALRDLHNETGRHKLDVRKDYSLMVYRVAAEKAIAAAEAAGIKP